MKRWPRLLRLDLLRVGMLLGVAALAGCGKGGGDGGSASAPSGGSVPSSPSVVDVATYHNDTARTGQNLNETLLTPANVNAASFGKVGFYPVDGKVDAQPLVLSTLSIAGTTHTVLFVATEHATVFALDADSGAPLWKTSALAPGESPSDDHSCGQITPEMGITATPVVDRARGPHGAIYVVAMSKDGSGGYHQRVHALDLSTGAELFGGPTEVAASYPGNGANSSNGRVVFDPKQYAERAALLLLNGVLYTSWTSHCDLGVYGGWMMGYSADTLKQTTVLSLTPNGSGGSVWMSGAGLASDGASIYLLGANGTFDSTLDADGFPSQSDFGNAFLKLNTSNGLSVADYFAVSNTIDESNRDEDLGSGGALVLPDLADTGGAIHHLALGAGKDRSIYIVNRDAMGKFDPNANHIEQQIDGQLAGSVFSMPAYFNNTVYFGAVGDRLKAFTIANARVSTVPSSQSANSFPFPGATPGISANGAANGIVWAIENGSTAALHAYDAANLANELYNSNQKGTRDQFGAGNKFVTPTIANGKVFVGTTNGVAVFGLLPKS